MTSTETFLLPDVGEGLTEAEISSWRVAAGDTVEVNQIIVEIETAKSLVELPSPYAGVVAELHAAEGDTVDVGRPLISISTLASAASAIPSPVSTEMPADAVEAEPKLLVGYGAKVGAPRRRRRGHGTATVSDPMPPTSVDQKVRSKPPVRKLAKDLGIDLSAIEPTGPGGLITRADVLDASSRDSPIPTAATTDATETRIPIKGVRKHTAAAMVSSAFTAPHVTEFITLDVTNTMELRTKLEQRREFKDVKLSPLTLIARAFLRAIQRTPSSNSRWDETAQEIVQMREINLGIAAATPRGLVVPNIRSAQTLSLVELASAIAELAQTARAGRTSPEAMSKGTVTISNFGVFGVDSGTPILNPGETAILGIGTISRKPWVVGEGSDERIEPRWVTTLALSFDHRVMDGQQGSNLLADTAASLRDPSLFVL